MVDQTTTTVFINPEGGHGRQANAVDDLCKLLAARLPDATVVVLKPGASITDQARAAIAAGATTLVAAGGDGTINAVAQPVVSSGVRLGVLPFGTRNHFVRAMNLPLDLAAAVDLLATAEVKRIDVGRVNEHYFLNNASLGIYPELIHLRDQEANSVHSTLNMLRAAWKLLGHYQPIRLRVRHDAAAQAKRVWLLFVGNNQYTLDPLRLTQPRPLDHANLDVILIAGHRRWSLGRVLVAARRNHLTTRRMQRFATGKVEVELADDTRCEVAFDGETKTMTTPFIFESVPQALQVLVPTVVRTAP